MKFTIIIRERKSRFIQQDYDKLEDANARLEAYADRAKNLPYKLAVVGVDDDGEFHEVKKAPAPLENKPATK